ncbi:Rho GTPase activation protein [Mucor mucedo]|uniref:Rho GTPase activation protein n=1 Tax=Mucor mucedo TaxID=29922 RepID=UPI002220BE4D|nr:Rho GTPase activation protein [Mucor mucedo]KAI7888286.1 Rho GTPase activation protein [Mucor mucedo]
MDVESNKDTPIKSWWKKVTNNTNSKPVYQKQEDQIFGVPLLNSLKCARAVIAYVDNDVQYFGFIPVIVAKCGSFLKDQGLYTEGVFRMSGSAKRIGQLQQIFNTPPDYGRQLDWKGYSIHDAANVLRRFLNYLPEPVIVNHLYQPFRNVVLLNISEEEKVVQFQNLIEQLPEPHQYLLFYLLDLLSFFSQNVHITKMDTFNLASVFTPGILLDPEHALNPAQYKTSQKVVQFLVEHQHCFKMPHSSRFPVVPPQKQDEEVSSTEEATAEAVEGPEGSSSARHSFSYHHTLHQKSLDLTAAQESFISSTSTTTDSVFSTNTRPVSVDLSGNKDYHIKRAKTMPSRRSRFGLNDPLQIVQLNKSVIETTGHDK